MAGGDSADSLRGNVDAKWGNTRRLAACFDPLNGIGNEDAAIWTGTVVRSFHVPCAVLF